MTKSITGGDTVARSLVAHGVETLFAIPGVQLDPVFAGLFDVQDKIRIVHARHEQGVALMAFGYAHITRKPAALLVVPGPGLLNATTGMLVAHACNTPLLCLVGQNERRFIGSGFGVLHELDNQIGIAATMTKHAVRVTSPESLAGTLATAFDQMLDHRQRPVYVELPTDIVRMPAAGSMVVSRLERVLPVVEDDDVHMTARALAEADFPLLMAGGGATHCRGPLQMLAEMLQAPVGMSENGLGTMDCRHPLAFSQTGAHQLWQQADCVLALGTRLYAPVFNWGFDDELRIIKVDVDPEELNRLPVAALNTVHAETEQFLLRLVDVLPQYLSAKRSTQWSLSEVRHNVARQLAPLDFHRRFLEAIREELGEQGVLVVDVTQMNHACLDLLPVYEPRTYISSGYQGALGFGLCTALGVKVGRPDLPVVCLAGDGGFMYAAQELATAKQFNIPVVMIVINDGAYKNVQNILDGQYDGRAIATELENPDFVKFADSFNVPARTVSTVDEMQEVLREALASNTPWLIDYQVQEVPSAFWLRFLPQVRKNIPENEFGLSNE